MGLTKLNNSSLNAVTAAGLPSGTVLQVIYSEASSSNVNMSGSSWTDVGLTAVITPTSTSSKILVLFNPQFRIQNSSSDCGMGWQILRSGTVVRESATYYHTYLYGGSGQEVEFRGTDSFNHTDTPSSTSALTYTFKGRLHNGVARTNDQGNKCMVTLLEIAA